MGIENGGKDDRFLRGSIGDLSPLYDDIMLRITGSIRSRIFSLFSPEFVNKLYCLCALMHNETWQNFAE